jgi:hypothetical protein
VWTRGIDVMIANDCAMLYVMVVRPGLVTSLLAVLIANALAFAGRTMIRRRTGAVTLHAARGVS